MAGVSITTIYEPYWHPTKFKECHIFAVFEYSRFEDVRTFLYTYVNVYIIIGPHRAIGRVRPYVYMMRFPALSFRALRIMGKRTSRLLLFLQRIKSVGHVTETFRFGLFFCLVTIIFLPH